MSIREFAAHLGVSERMVSKWEAAGSAIRPRQVNQAALDTSLALATDDQRSRFTVITLGEGAPDAIPGAGTCHLVRHPIDGKLMTLVEAGPFTSRDDPQARWLLAYFIDVHATTHSDFARYVESTGTRPPARWPGGRMPDSLADDPLPVSVEEAEAYAAWASKHLPTPSQWERAARGDEGMSVDGGPEWCTGLAGVARWEPSPVKSTGDSSPFRCVIPAGDLLALVAI